jgi:hypothetical protein
LTNLESKLNEVDWQAYEKKILSLTINGIQAYKSRCEATTDAKVSQISIWTDVTGGMSAVNFETIKHVKEYNVNRVAVRLTRFSPEEEAEVLAATKNFNPADFFCVKAAECYHPEFDILDELLEEDEQIKFAESFVSNQLQVVRAKIVNAGLLRDLPHEDTVWFGISSENDWYDHEIPVEL